jgi:hypothetical protein
MRWLLALALLACERADSPTPPTPVPSPPTRDATLAPPACDVVILLEPGGLWIGVGPDLRCFHPGVPDDAWLRAQLGGLKRRLARCDDAAVEVAGRPTAKFADVIRVLDIVRETGYERFNALPHESLSILETRFTGVAKASCIE